jgi:hypothetical protein
VQMLIDLDTHDATIRMSDPDYRVEKTKLKPPQAPKDWTSRRELTRLVCSILRKGPKR